MNVYKIPSQSFIISLNKGDSLVISNGGSRALYKAIVYS